MIAFQTEDGREPMPVLGQAKAEGRTFPYLYYPILENTGIVKHCFTTRMGGVSQGYLESLNLSFARGDDEEAVKENFRRVSLALGTEYDKFVFTDQTHTANVKRVGKEDAGKGLTGKRDYFNIDGLITDEPGLILSAFYADCVPLYFVDPRHRAIGLSHSGWRGTAGRIGRETMLAMKREFQTEPEDVLCAIGPSICQSCYEISQDVAAEFQREFSYYEDKILQDKGNGKYQLDLWRANEIVLMEAGVKQEHLAVTNLCTCCNPKLLFSHRASHGKRGNLGAFLCLN
ncbi:peptidoglycan editing factor PgeF [Petralouisia muris]|uniref:peptidoglycan editing factor PgeF n=1 Tax=Petralouisia muris TaxID=3032872 RepID=UPI0023B7FAEE|nr:peptidoglycan editing factor PgeF [Petralouisia muris]